ncbi:hypothetical protein PG984_015189 [Apiospora sp. TS-2023a]
METAETFQLMRLPPELRHEIWGFAIPTDRVLLTSVDFNLLRPLPPPAIAWVCRESRAAAFKYGRHYAIGDESNSKQTWFSPDFDRVMLNFSNRNNLHTAIGSFALDVRHVLVRETYPHDLSWYYYTLNGNFGNNPHLADLVVYPNLQSIGVVQGGVVVEAGSAWNLSATGIPQRVRPHGRTATHSEQPAVCSCSESGELHDQKSNRHWLPDLARPYKSKCLWRVLKTWFQQHYIFLTPRNLDHLTSGHPIDLPWVTQLKGQAPHVYPAEMFGFGNRSLRASAGPRCMNMTGNMYDWINDGDLVERLVWDFGKVDLD